MIALTITKICDAVWRKKTRFYVPEIAKHDTRVVDESLSQFCHSGIRCLIPLFHLQSSFRRCEAIWRRVAATDGRGFRCLF